MNINEQIDYEWKWGWDGMSEPKPIVNSLLKAMLQKNVEEMERLFDEGAELKSCNEDTFRRTIFHVLDDYEVINCIVKHGFTALYEDSCFSDGFECYDPEGYGWGCLGRAWDLRAYDVMELLAQNGFKSTLLHYHGEVYSLERVIFVNDDIRAAKILLENGYWRKTLEEMASSYQNSKVTYFLNENAVVHRKTIALSNFKYSTYPKPELVKSGLFNKKKIKKYNDRLMADYYDYIEVHNKFVDEIGVEKWKNICKKLNQESDWLTQAMREVINRKT